MAYIQLKEVTFQINLFVPTSAPPACLYEIMI